jgi:uncharacterized protein YkwD
MNVKAGTDRRPVITAGIAAALGAVCFGVLVSSPAGGASARGTTVDCGPYANSTIRDATPRQLRRALGCLINNERSARDKRRLRGNPDLGRLARKHTKVMVETDCFQHQCEGERPLRNRIENSGYLKPGMRYGYGQNLGCSRTPAGMVSAWMQNDFHRRNILNRRFRHFGIGAKRRSPYPKGEGDCSPERRFVTYTVIFGWRKRAD